MYAEVAEVSCAVNGGLNWFRRGVEAALLLLYKLKLFRVVD